MQINLEFVCAGRMSAELSLTWVQVALKN